MSQVVLYNDDVNSFEHVILTLMRVFGHTHPVAAKLAWDAHKNNRTVAEVEGHSEAVTHKQQLQSAGLTAEVERV
jgi:ATP-dependent Clp protease adaptor protein ClpS